MKKTVEICGRKFEVINSNMHPVAPITGYNREEIFDVYANPSSTKQYIWRDWCNWCDEVNKLENVTLGIEIASYNTNIFTINGSLRVSKDGMLDKVYDLYITPAHNRLYVHSY